MGPLIIDVEASGFGRGSYPVEVGVAMPSGETHCMIIRPAPDWRHWDENAEALHGIQRDVLLRYGRSPLEAALHLNHWLAGQVVYSDAWGNDSSWLALLYEYAGISQHFQLESLRSLITDVQAEYWHEVKAQVILDLGCRRHRASHDALILQRTFMRTAEISPELVVNRKQRQSL